MRKLILFTMLSLTAHADQGVTVVPHEPAVFNDVNFSGSATGAARFRMNIRTQCFGTNLRSVPNPLSPSSDIRMEAKFRRVDGVEGTIKATFPAKYSFDINPPTATPLDL